jgi:hypothetical protein
MAACDVCGNDYDRVFTVSRGEASGTYDSLECAIHAWAPGCRHCGCRILGHGIETPEGMYCCASCARAGGHGQAVDRLT